MYLVDPAAEKKEKLTWAVQSLLMVTAFIFSCFWVTFLTMPREESRLTAKNLPLPKIDYHNIGHAALALAPQVKNPSLMPLIEELVLIGKNTRPDSSALSTVCLGLKSAGARKEMVCGQKLYISEQGNGFKISEANQGFAVTPLAPTDRADRGVVIQIEKDELKEEVVFTPSSLFQRSLEDEDFLLALRQGKLWGPDMFLQQWGGDEYSSLCAQHKVEIGGKVYFLSVGDTLWWDGDEWAAGRPQFSEVPLFKLLSANAQGVKGEVWDPTGFSSSIIQIPLQSPIKTPLKPDEIMTAVRSRSPSEITCQLGKRRVTVKEGDWWVRSDGRWRALKNTYDLEAFLHHEIQGELFIFEKIENGKDKITLKGRSFDKMRTQSQPIALVFNADKKLPTHPKREPSRAALFAKNKVAMPRVEHQKSEGEEKQ